MLKLDPINILFTIVNILVLFTLVKRFLFKPIHKILDERQAQADSVLADATKARDEAEKLKTENEKLLKSTEKERDAILSEAREKAAVEYEKVVSEAGKKAEEITVEADRDAENEHERMLEDARRDITDLVVEAGSKLSMTKADPESDRVLYDRFLEALDREETV
ncbi:MAG: F0F1 ATP synthase subunit B [Lachnospiraceae bacterium]|nr:F0F1 ATP synthase subunit B [Lachnospiraceae bacterium]